MKTEIKILGQSEGVGISLHDPNAEPRDVTFPNVTEEIKKEVEEGKSLDATKEEMYSKLAHLPAPRNGKQHRMYQKAMKERRNMGFIRKSSGEFAGKIYVDSRGQKYQITTSGQHVKVND